MVMRSILILGLNTQKYRQSTSVVNCCLYKSLQQQYIHTTFCSVNREISFLSSFLLYKTLFY